MEDVKADLRMGTEKNEMAISLTETKNDEQAVVAEETAIHEHDLNVDPSIDVDDLTSEWALQAMRYQEVGEAWSDASRDVELAKIETELAKTELDEAKAGIDLAVRANPAMYGLAKITESAVSNLVEVDRRTKQARDAWVAAKRKQIEAQHAADVLKVALTAFQHRKNALESLSELAVAGYYGEPRAKPMSREQIEEQQKRLIRRRMVRKREEKRG